MNILFNYLNEQAQETEENLNKILNIEEEAYKELIEKELMEEIYKDEVYKERYF